MTDIRTYNSYLEYVDGQTPTEADIEATKKIHTAIVPTVSRLMSLVATPMFKNRGLFLPLDERDLETGLQTVARTDKYEISPDMSENRLRVGLQSKVGNGGSTLLGPMTVLSHRYRNDDELGLMSPASLRVHGNLMDDLNESTIDLAYPTEVRAADLSQVAYLGGTYLNALALSIGNYRADQN